MRRLAITAGAIVAIAFAAPVSAHNAGHLFINGVCVAVGSGRDAPSVGAGAPQTATGRLDLEYDPKNGVDLSDQYGARLAADQGNTPILPGDCPVS